MQLCLLALLSLVLQSIYCASKCQSCLQLCPFTHFTDITFTVDPVSINTTLNSTVIFTCKATDVDVLIFTVNGVQADHIKFKKSFTESTSDSNGLKTGRLQAIAYDFNNNTNIACRGERGDSNDNFESNDSKPALLLIQGSERLFGQSVYFIPFLPYIGLLASVGNLNFTLINGSGVLLSWTAPYTLDNVPITGYHINDNSGRMLNTTDLSYKLSSPNPAACDITTVTVSAVNGAGRGQPANTRFYYNRGIL